MHLVIIKYNAGNVQSVMYALERLNVPYTLTDDENTIRNADKVIFPGVGEASSTMAYLKERGLDCLIPSLEQPVLGVCLGMQLMCRYSEERDTDCLGIFDHEVKKFPDSSLKVPHMGWNALKNTDSPLLEDIGELPYVYFVHSYYVEEGPFTISSCDYGIPFSAAMQKNNFYATQFHPEKSGKLGAQILKNFIEKV
ncbi:MAG: imidazole glycerol phosphate synthase subunit HisH [Bacteroidota bacterium]